MIKLKMKQETKVPKYKRPQLLLVLVFLMSLVSLSFVAGYDFVMNYNESASVFEQYNYTITPVADNSTYKVYLFHDNITATDVNVNNYTIDFNSTNQSFNLTIDFNFSSVFGNKTWHLKINNSINNNTISKVLHLNVTLDPENVSTWHNLDTGGFELDICSHNLPENHTKEIIVGGSNNTLVNITSSQGWFKYPQQLNFTGDYVTFKVNISLPADLGIGNHSEYLMFDFENESDSVQFLFNVEDCGLKINYEKYLAECDKYEFESDDYMYCRQEAILNYNQDWLYSFGQRNKTEVVNVTVNVTKEIPIEVYRIDNKSIEDLVSETASLTLSSEKIKELSESRDDWKNQAQEHENTIKELQGIIKIQQEDMNQTCSKLWERKNYEASIKPWWRVTLEYLFWIILIGSIIYYIKQKYYWSID